MTAALPPAELKLEETNLGMDKLFRDSQNGVDRTGGVAQKLFSAGAYAINLGASGTLVTTPNDLTTAVGGLISLRVAVENAFISGRTVEFSPDVFKMNGGATEVVLTNGEITIDNDVKILGLMKNNGLDEAFINVKAPVTYGEAAGGSGASAHRVFNITKQVGGDAPSVEISNLLISGGDIGAQDGGGMLISGGEAVSPNDVKLKNVTVFGSGAENGGGIAVKDHATLDLDGCFIQGNAASANGGGLYAAGGTVTADSAVFMNNIAANGAGAYVGPSGVLQSKNGSFTRNEADTSGGGLYSEGAAAIEGGVIGENTAGNSGGGLYSAGGEGSSVKGTFFRKNSIAGGSDTVQGGAVYNRNTSALDIDGCSFDGNTALSGSIGSGGGAYNAQGGAMFVANSTFHGNTAGNGGALYGGGTGSNLVAAGCTLAGNRAAQAGGGLYKEAAAGAQVLNSIVLGNYKGDSPDANPTIHICWAALPHTALCITYTVRSM
jgi:predicted outer membrane repeat protein